MTPTTYRPRVYHGDERLTRLEARALGLRPINEPPVYVLCVNRWLLVSALASLAVWCLLAWAIGLLLGGRS